MTKIVIIEKSGSVKEKNVTSKTFDFETIYKYAGFRKSDNFKCRHIWKLKNGKYMSLYARNKGLANTENKCELPPPIDKDLFFGNMVVLLSKDKTFQYESLIDIDSSVFEKYYEQLFGGFEDIGVSDDDDNESDELENVDKEQLTKDGYLKDDFIVDSDEEEEVVNKDVDDNEEETTDNSGTSYYDSELDEEDYISEDDYISE